MCMNLDQTTCLYSQGIGPRWSQSSSADQHTGKIRCDQFCYKCGSSSWTPTEKCSHWFLTTQSSLCPPVEYPRLYLTWRLSEASTLYQLCIPSCQKNPQTITKWFSSTVECLEDAVLWWTENVIWNAFRDIFPEAVRKGYHFHWTQALWRKVQFLGFLAYNTNSPVQQFIRQLIGLPF